MPYNFKFCNPCANQDLLFKGEHSALADPGPNGTQFFRFCIRFRQKSSTSEVGVPQRVGDLQMGKPGSATALHHGACHNAIPGRSHEYTGER